MLSTILTGAVIAISFSAPPGPVAVETIRRGLRGGFGPALHVQLGSIIGDMLWCLAALLGLAPLVQVDWVRGVLAVGGAGVLIVLGILGVRDALKQSAVQSLDAAAPAQGAFRSGMAISMANPMAVGYWLSAGSALIGAGVVGASGPQTLSFVAGFLGGTFAWALVMALAVRWGKQIMTPVIFRLITFVCGVALLGFGATLAWQLLSVAV